VYRLPVLPRTDSSAILLPHENDHLRVGKYLEENKNCLPRARHATAMSIAKDGGTLAVTKIWHPVLVA
jgi:hypothetical protein